MPGRLDRFLRADAPAIAVVLRVVTGAIFLSEGIQKFLFPSELGPGRFAKIGIPWPDVSAPFVGAVESVGGAMLILGAATRFAAAPLLVSMTVAIATTKLAHLGKNGFWKTMHDARTDLMMIASLVFFLVRGADPASIDGRRALRTRAPR